MALLTGAAVKQLMEFELGELQAGRRWKENFRERLADSPHTVIGEMMEKLYDGVILDVSDVPTTGREPDCYKRLLSLDNFPVKEGADIVDLGVGFTRMTPQKLGLDNCTLRRTDYMPRTEGVEHANLLSLPFETGQFDETWAVYSHRYLELCLPIPVEIRINHIRDADNVIGTANSFKAVMGMQGISEMIRVTKPGGRVRLASFLTDFTVGDGLITIITAIGEGKIPGLTLNGEAETIRQLKDNKDNPEANLFIELDKNFDHSLLSKFLAENAEKLIPGCFAALLSEIIGEVDGWSTT